MPFFYRMFQVIFVLGLSIYHFELTAQKANEIFGKNRLQYHDDQYTWTRYESENFIYHWYGKSTKPAKYIIGIAENYYESISSIIEHRLNDKYHFIVYADQTDLYQSNLLLVNEKFNDIPILIDDKMLVSFNGSYPELRAQVKSAIAHAFVQNLYSGSFFQEIIRENTNKSLPNWYTTGLAEHLAKPWTVAEQRKLNLIINNTKTLD